MTPEQLHKAQRRIAATAQSAEQVGQGFRTLAGAMARLGTAAGFATVIFTGGRNCGKHAQYEVEQREALRNQKTGRMLERLRTAARVYQRRFTKQIFGYTYTAHFDKPIF